MTVQEALYATQGRDAGSLNRSAVRYAETLLLPGEIPSSAVIANVATRKEHFPGVVVLTNQRIFAACGLPGIKRSVVIPMNELEKCDETSSFLNYKAVFHGRDTDISLTVDPEIGERFSRCIAVMNGEETEFDDVREVGKSRILNPILRRNLFRQRRAREKEQARRKEQQEAVKTRLTSKRGDVRNEEDAQETARRLNQDLAQARLEGEVADTDPRAVAARLAAELAQEDSKRQK